MANNELKRNNLRLNPGGRLCKLADNQGSSCGKA